MNILEKYRRKNGLTYDELAKKLHTTTPNAWRLCNKGLKCPKSIVAISNLLKMEKTTVFKQMTEKENQNGKEND